MPRTHTSDDVVGARTYGQHRREPHLLTAPLLSIGRTGRHRGRLARRRLAVLVSRELASVGAPARAGDVTLQVAIVSPAPSADVQCACATTSGKQAVGQAAGARAPDLKLTLRVLNLSIPAPV